MWGDRTKRCPLMAKYIHCRNCPAYTAAGRRLLDRPLPPGYQKQWASQLAAQKATERRKISTAFIFRAGAEWLAISASLIQEVVNMGIIHSLPHVDSKILRGIVNVRGRLEICVSIGNVLGIQRLIKPATRTRYVTPERLVVARHQGYTLTFPVSEVLGHTKYLPEMIRDLPVTVSGSKAVYTRGILCLGNKDIGFLKDDMLFKTLTKDLS